MPIPYSERKKRRKQLKQALPSELREHIALRHVEAVSRFSTRTQQTLVEVLQHGVSAPAAISFMKAHPEAPADEVVRNCRAIEPVPQGMLQNGNGTELRSPNGSRAMWSSRAPGFEEAISDLTDLLQTCYPDMPTITAEAMAGSALMAGVLAIIQAQQACLAAPEAASDFVLVVLCGLASQTMSSLDQVVSRKPAYRRALAQSGVPWPGQDRAHL